MDCFFCKGGGLWRDCKNSNRHFKLDYEWYTLPRISNGLSHFVEKITHYIKKFFEKFKKGAKCIVGWLSELFRRLTNCLIVQYRKLIKWWRRKLNPSCLSKAVEKQKKTDKDLNRVLASEKRKPLWMPNSRTTLMVCSLVFVSFFLVHFSHLSRLWNFDFIGCLKGLYSNSTYQWIVEKIASIPVIGNESNHYQNFIAIHAGISAVILPLAIFVAETLRDKEDRFRGKVLIKESFFFPLVLGTLLIFPVFIWGDIDLVWGIVVLGVMTLFASLSLARIIIVLAKDGEMEKKKNAVLNDVLRENFLSSLDAEITKRLSDNHLDKYAKEDMRLELRPFRISRDRGFTPIKLFDFGFVQDINLSKLNDLLDEVQRHVTSSKMKARPEGAPAQNTDPEGHLVELAVLYDEEITNRNNEVIWVKSSVIQEDDALYDRLEKLVQKVILVGKDSIQTNNKDEISNIKARCLTAIGKKDYGSLEKALDQYMYVFGEFYRYFELYGGGFSRDQAEKERTTLFGGFKTVRRISRDFEDVYEKAMTSNDLEIVRQVGYLPMRVAQIALQNQDHYLFQEFIRFPQYMYRYSFEEQNSDRIREFMKHRTWKYLKEFADFHLEYKLKYLHGEDVNEEDIRSTIDYGLYVLKTFQGLLKAAFDRGELDDFKKFKDATKRLFSKEHGYDQEQIEVVKKLSEYKDQMFFGMTMWILHAYYADKSDIKKRFLSDVRPVLGGRNIKDLTSIFLQAHNFEVEKIWGWDNWELEGRPDGVVYAINTLEKLEKTYAILALTAIKSMEDEAIKQIDLPHNRDLAFLAEGTRDLMKVLDSIEEAPDDWSDLLTPEAISKVPALKALMLRAKEAQDEEDFSRVRSADLSDMKLQEFREAVLDDYQNTNSIQQVFADFRCLKELSRETPQGENRFGVNTTFEKAAFIDDWHVHYVHSGTGFGASIAYGENRSVLEKLREKAETVSDFSEEKMNEKIAKIKNKRKTVILISNTAMWKSGLERSYNFVPHWRIPTGYSGPRGTAGYYKINGCHIPAYEIYTQTEHDGIYIVDMLTVGEFVRKNPMKVEEDENNRRGPLYIKIQEFVDGKDPMEQFINDAPDWLTEQGDETHQRQYLKEKVLLNIFVRFEYKEGDNLKVYYFGV